MSFKIGFQTGPILWLPGRGKKKARSGGGGGFWLLIIWISALVAWPVPIIALTLGCLGLIGFNAWITNKKSDK